MWELIQMAFWGLIACELESILSTRLVPRSEEAPPVPEMCWVISPPGDQVTGFAFDPLQVA